VQRAGDRRSFNRDLKTANRNGGPSLKPPFNRGGDKRDVLKLKPWEKRKGNWGKRGKDGYPPDGKTSQQAGFKARKGCAHGAKSPSKKKVKTSHLRLGLRAKDV